MPISLSGVVREQKLFVEVIMDQHWHLGKQDFFADMPLEREAFTALARRRDIARNDIIFFEDDPGGSCFYLERGLIKIFQVTHSGKEPIFFLRRSGEMFGLAEVMEAAARKTTAQALTPCLLHEISRADFERFLSEHFTVMIKVIQTMGRRLRYLGEQVGNLMVCDVGMRLMKLLFYLSHDQLGNEDTWSLPVNIPVKLTQEQMAAMTGSCQQTVSDVLKRLQKEGLIRVRCKEIIILNPLKLLAKAEMMR